MAGNWTTEEKREILKAFTVMATIQKTYGKEVDIKPTLQAWEYLLADRYNGKTVVQAMEAYMRKSNDIPTPADLIAIIEPPPNKISTAEFLHAKKQWELEGYPPYGQYRYTVKQYEAQEQEEREPRLEGSNGFRKIGQVSGYLE